VSIREKSKDRFDDKFSGTDNKMLAFYMQGCKVVSRLLEARLMPVLSGSSEMKPAAQFESAATCANSGAT
jgi:hypothetical protein